MKKRVANRKCLFLSGVQKELQHERRAIKEFIEGDILLRRFFEVFLFENLPASDRKADDMYLEKVEQCDTYVGLFGEEYGAEDTNGISPTEREFDLASAKGKPRLIFVKGTDDKARHPKMLNRSVCGNPTLPFLEIHLLPSRSTLHTISRRPAPARWI